MNEPKKLNHFKIVPTHAGSVTERFGAPLYGDHNESKGRGLTPSPRHVVVALDKVGLLHDICRCLVA